MRFVPLKQFHVEQIAAQPRQPNKALMKGAELQALLNGRAEALVIDDYHSAPEGRAIGCAGLLDCTGGIGRAWALFSAEIPRAAWPLLVRRMSRAIDEELASGRFHRISAECALDWKEGHRLLLTLGMQFEGFTRGGLPGGRHGAMYAKVGQKVERLPVRAYELLRVSERLMWEDTLRHPMPAARRAA